MSTLAEAASGNILTHIGRQAWPKNPVPTPQKEFFTINLGKELARYRSLRGLSENEVAEKLGLSKNYIRLIEWGLICNVSIEIRQQIIELVQAG